MTHPHHTTSNQMSPPIESKRWDIFCRVIDNFGDIGVCWRLAKILQQDFQQQVRLWVDEPQALAALEPTLNPALNQQTIHQIDVCLWADNFPISRSYLSAGHLPSVVIEAFGCELPSAYLHAMLKQPPVWINLEYLSAESWVPSFHGLPSKQANGLNKLFFFPSVLANTGGLMREADLLQRRDMFIANPADHQAWCQQWGLKTPLKNSFKVSLFAYENNALNNLIENWIQHENHDQPIEVYLPQGRLLSSAEKFFAQSLHAGDSITRGNMTLHILPFLPQAEYDKLLWLCDLNFVRGEESFVRAQWAGKPFIWHIYPTDDNAHWDKISAFLDIYTQDLDPEARQAIIAFMHGWNQQSLTAENWTRLMQTWSSQRQHAQNWVAYLEKLGELTANLVKTVQSKV